MPSLSTFIWRMSDLSDASRTAPPSAPRRVRWVGRGERAPNGARFIMPFRAESSACPTSASRPSSTRSPVRRRRLRPTIRSRRSIPTSARLPCPTIACAFCKNSPMRSRVVPATVRFVDIAGLVRGASTGQGLGNAFLEPHSRDRCGRDGRALLRRRERHSRRRRDPIRGAISRSSRSSWRSPISATLAEADCEARARGSRDPKLREQRRGRASASRPRWKRARRRGRFRPARSKRGLPPIRFC